MNLVPGRVDYTFETATGSTPHCSIEHTETARVRRRVAGVAA
jgi:hypothetical protein